MSEADANMWSFIDIVWKFILLQNVNFSLHCLNHVGSVRTSWYISIFMKLGVWLFVGILCCTVFQNFHEYKQATVISICSTVKLSGNTPENYSHYKA